jgi:hypothetical protein
MAANYEDWIVTVKRDMPNNYVVQGLIRKIEEQQRIIREIVSQCDQGGDFGKVFARDNCIQEARKVLR